ncbi:response regulator [Chitinispirillales bacterium ANBcel5]|uniref:response regulator n=1 Tax=Cellulosispirillum alkaliphilum TaxID=3039283 RepID=UPI002A5451DE|nr:response regulator [Chitinispirillales bacterium ANBcel5]
MRKLLIVDDEIEIRRMLSRHFRLLGYSVEVAENGVEALQKMSENYTEVLISDIKMPEMSGVDLLREVRSQYPMVRSIMITGYVTLENALACMRLGADTCIFKPFKDLDEIELAVKKAIDSLDCWNSKLRELRGMK